MGLPQNGNCLFTIHRDDNFCDIWLIKQDFDIADVVFQENETCDAKWLGKGDIRKMVTDGTFIPFYYLERLFVMADRERIIDKLKEKLEPLSFINALWLEGADASGLVDEYSDLDFWVDFEDEYERQAYESVETALQEIAEFDYYEVLPHGHPKIKQRIYHLTGTGKYLMIDFCWQFHSRDREETVLIEGNKVESAKVVFDKADVVRFKPLDKNEYAKSNEARYKECVYRYSQHNRVLKYVHRGNYLEAYAYYNRYVLEPLVDMLRLIHTPANADYSFVHISYHIPETEVKKLENYARISSLPDIEEKTELAKGWFQELRRQYEKMT